MDDTMYRNIDDTMYRYIDDTMYRYIENEENIANLHQILLLSTAMLYNERQN